MLSTNIIIHDKIRGITPFKELDYGSFFFDFCNLPKNNSANLYIKLDVNTGFNIDTHQYKEYSDNEPVEYIPNVYISIE